MFKSLIFGLATLLIGSQVSAQQHKYQVKIDRLAQLAYVDASIELEGNTLTLFNTNPMPNFPNGQADFLRNIQVFDKTGRTLKLEDKGEGEYQLEGNQTIRLKYEVKLDHDKLNWPAGNEEVLYHTSEGLMLSGYTLFLVPGEKMSGQTLVEFELPADWKSHAALKPLSTQNQFIAKSRRELVNNAYFFGTAKSSAIQAGGLDIEIVLGARYYKQKHVIEGLLLQQLKSYFDMFGSKPQADRYLIIINQGDSGDGGAFSGSFSQLLRGDAEVRTRAIWGRVIAHELLHFWNGLSLIPKSDQEEWFKEGVTDYLTIKSMAKNGLLHRPSVIQWLENLSRGQLVARRVQNVKGSVQEAAQNKHQNWLLVYGGGSIAGLAMDVELRKRSGNRFGLEDLMKEMYHDLAVSQKPYTLDDIINAANKMTSTDFSEVLKKLVQSSEMVELAPIFDSIGLQLEQYLLLEHNLINKGHPSREEQERFKKMFGMKL
jgi:predicted metalloprotease with PDZ domain